MAGRLAGCTHDATSLSHDVPGWISCSADVLVSLNCVVLVEFTCIDVVYCIIFRYFCVLAALWGSPVCDTALGVSG